MDSTALTKSSYWTCIACSTVLMMSTNVASGVYPLYKSLHVLTSFQITEVFAAYIGGLIPTLLVSSWLSAKYGLRTIVIFALIFAILGTAIIGFGGTFVYFLLGRVLQGVAVGISTGNLAAAIVRLEPSGNHHRAALATGLAMTLGGGTAPVIGAAIAQYITEPTLTPYLLIIIFLALLLLPSSILFNFKRHASTITWPRVPEPVREAFVTSAIAAFLAWSVTAIFLSVVPVIIASHLQNSSLVAPATAAGVILIVSGITQVFAMRGHPQTALQSGYCILAVAAVLLILGEVSEELAVILLSSVVGGIGHGLTFLGATRILNAAISSLEARTEVLAAYNVAIYLGVGVPALCVGALSTAMSASLAVCAFGCFVIVLALFGLIKFRTNAVQQSVQ